MKEVIINKKSWKIVDDETPVFQSPPFFHPDAVPELMTDLVECCFPGVQMEELRRKLLDPYIAHERAHALGDLALQRLGASLRFSPDSWSYVSEGRTPLQRILMSTAPSNMSAGDRAENNRAINDYALELLERKSNL